MSEKVLIITSPDDVLLDGIRILHVGLTEEQSSEVSNALLQFNSPCNIINYVWKMGDPVDWLLDKNVKSDITIFNANPVNNGAIELIIGYVAAQPRSYYFGTLRDLQKANDRAIYNVNDMLNLLENISKKHDK